MSDPRDLLEECITDLDPQKKDYPAFQATFCARCRNRNCVHAKRAEDTFSRRVSTQMDRLFNPPASADNKHPKYAMLTDFVDLRAVAEQIEVRTRPEPRPEMVQGPVDKGLDWRDAYLDKKFGPQDELLDEGEPPAPENLVTPHVGPVHHAPNLPVKPGNTQVSRRGIILPGEPDQVPAPIRPAVHPAVAAWGDSPSSATSDPNVRVVEKGAKVKMGDK